MKSFSLYLVLLTAIFVFFGCQSDQTSKEETLFANYEIRYLQEEKQFRAQLSYSSGDSLTRKPKHFPTVNFGKYAMERRNLRSKGIRYQYEKNIPYPSPMSFRTIDKNNIEMNHQITMSPIDSFYLEENIEKSKDLNLTWLGAPLKANETLVLLFTDQENKASSQIVRGPTKQSTITIPSNRLSELSIGKGELYLVKKQWSQKLDKNVQTNSLIEFYTRAIDIEVKN